MAPSSAYTDPRLVALYDSLNPFADDSAFYLGLAAELSAGSIVDIGCGTGLLACELAHRGHVMTGVDPSAAMLDVARLRPGGENVRWIEGDASAAVGAQADLALMTGHVAQVIPDDAWSTTLSDVHQALKPGGHLAFESRNPIPQPWTAWTPYASRRTVADPALGDVEVWHQLIDVRDDVALVESHYRFEATGEELRSTGELRFPTQEALTRSLTTAGFSVRQVYGDWNRNPAGPESPELIFVAVRA